MKKKIILLLLVLFPILFLCFTTNAKDGYDIELTQTFSENLDVPIIASGGAGNPQHVIDVFKLGKADAALAASIFHYNEYSIELVRKECQKRGIAMRF